MKLNIAPQNVSKGSPFPSNRHSLLLKACLSKGDEAKAAWENWSTNVDFETEIDGPAFRLLPLLYFNVVKFDVRSPLLGRLKGIYRQSWSNNHMLFLRCGQILNLLKGHGIEPLVLKGVPLSILYYKNFGVRPMSDIDLLVKKSDVRVSLNILQKEGYTIDDNQSVEYSLRYGNSLSLSNGTLELDLHWSPIIESNNSSSKHDWCGGALLIEVGGEQTASMSVENMLLHTLVHGLRYNPEPPIRWIPDAYTLIQKGVNWDVFTKSAIELRVTYTVMMGLKYLVANFNVAVPKTVIGDLKKNKFRFSEKLAYRYAIATKTIPPKTLYDKLFSNYFFYLRQTRFNNPVFQLLGFFKYYFFSFRTKFRLVQLLHKSYTDFSIQNSRRSYE